MKLHALALVCLTACAHSHPTVAVTHGDGWVFDMPPEYHMTAHDPLRAHAVSDGLYYGRPIDIALMPSSESESVLKNVKIELDPMKVNLDGKQGTLTVYTRAVTLGFRFDYELKKHRLSLICEGAQSAPVRLAMQCRTLLLRFRPR